MPSQVVDEDSVASDELEDHTDVSTRYKTSLHAFGKEVRFSCCLGAGVTGTKFGQSCS